MYLVGEAHPLKTESQILLERLVAAGQRLVIDAEVLQEILHRYTSIRRRESIGPAFRVVLDIVDEVFAVQKRTLCGLVKSPRARADVGARCRSYRRYGASRDSVNPDL